MAISASQLLLSMLIGFVLIRTFFALRSGMLSEVFAFFWIVFWLGVLFLIFQQDLVSDVAHRLGISRGVDMVIYISLVVIFYILYEVLRWLSDLDRKITKIVREITLREKEKK